MQADLVAEALVREYLKQHGHAATLAAFELEKPRTERSISNRSLLRKHVRDVLHVPPRRARDRTEEGYVGVVQLGLERFVARMKRKNPDGTLPSTLEMLTMNTVSKLKAAEEGGEAEACKGTTGSSIRPKSARPEAPAATDLDAPPKPRTGAFSTGFDDAVAASSMRPAPTATLVPTPAAELMRSSFTSASQPPRRPQSAFSGAATQQRGAAVARPGDDLLVEEDFDEDFDAAPLVAPPPRPASARTTVSFAGSSLLAGGGGGGGGALSSEDARQIKDRLFGKLGAPASWKQGFFFNTTVRGLEYGLVQKQGGPCGILAAVQAQLLAALTEPGGAPRLGGGEGSYTDALVEGIAASLWRAAQAGEQAAAVVSSSEHHTAQLSLDGMLRTARVTRCRSLPDTQRAVRVTLPLLREEDGWGIVLFLYSLVLSNGLQRVVQTLDDSSISLMGMHGYCTQDLVNLIVCGHAVSNVHDGVKHLDEHTQLGGVPAVGPVGFLSLFEWYAALPRKPETRLLEQDNRYQYIVVGEHYKRPTTPVWVVCCESHFTCLFAADTRALTDRKPFDLFYYDGLANQDEVIRFTVTHSATGGHTARGGDTVGSRGAMEGQLTPPLEFVIETRWPGVHVDWNGTDPIL